MTVKKNDTVSKFNILSFDAFHAMCIDSAHAFFQQESYMAREFSQRKALSETRRMIY